MRPLVVTLGVCLLIGACSSKHVSPPAVPDERTSAGPIMVPLVEEEVVAVAAPEQVIPYMPAPPVMDWDQFENLNAPKEPEPPAVKPPTKTVPPKVTRGPGKDVAFVQYPYELGVIYEVQSSPSSSVSILIPPGERLAARPLLDKEAWDVILVEAGNGAGRQEIIQIRPTETRLKATLALFTQSGLQFFCRLMALEQTTMVAVTWIVPKNHTTPIATQPQERPKPQRPQFKPPMIDQSRIHRGYSLMNETKYLPPWMPTSVYDDGRQTIITFKSPLDFTRAPVLLAQHVDGKPGIVQYAPYSVPGQPEKGAFLIVQGLWPVLTLKGTDGYNVRVVRQ